MSSFFSRFEKEISSRSKQRTHRKIFGVSAVRASAFICIHMQLIESIDYFATITTII